MKLRLILAMLMLVAMVGCEQKKGWQEKHIKGGVVYVLESDEIIKNDTLNGKASLMVAISPDNDTTYSIHFPTKSSSFSYRESVGSIGDYVEINNQKFWLPFLYLQTTNAIPELDLSCGYSIDLDKQTAPNLLTMPRIEVSYYHNNTPIKMTFIAE